MDRATMKSLDEYLKTLLPQYDFVKGNGYFYFSWNEDAPKDTPEPPSSIYIFALHQMSYQEWCEYILAQVEEWREDQ